MPGANPTPEGRVWRAERIILMQLLRDDHPERWTLGELEHGSPDLDPRVMREGLEQLEADVVVVIDGEQVWASPCARRLDALGLIGV